MFILERVEKLFPSSPSQSKLKTQTPPTPNTNKPKSKHQNKASLKLTHETRRSHKITQDDKLPCDLCSSSFATRKEFKRHQSVAHSRGLAFRCRVEGCTKAKSGHVYNRRDNFVRHLRTAHARAEGADVEGMVKACAFVRGERKSRR